jgi:deoxycytidylate deaminase
MLRYMQGKTTDAIAKSRGTSLEWSLCSHRQASLSIVRRARMVSTGDNGI